MLHKPVGAVCQFVPTAKRKKILLGDFYDFPEGTMSIGRLDADSEGLLLLTTDGKVSNNIRQKNIEKEYYVQVDGEITDEAIETLQEGVEIGLPGGKKYQTLPCKAKKVTDLSNIPPNQKKERDARHGPKSWASITVTEGKFRQVRKMTAAVGFPTLRLVRIRIDTYTLGDLNVGEVKEIEIQEKFRPKSAV
ncbi:MAG: pseudouridine synthase [Lishizhenia sp.]